MIEYSLLNCIQYLHMTRGKVTHVLKNSLFYFFLICQFTYYIHSEVWIEYHEGVWIQYFFPQKISYPPSSHYNWSRKEVDSVFVPFILYNPRKSSVFIHFEHLPAVRRKRLWFKLVKKLYVYTCITGLNVWNKWNIIHLISHYNDRCLLDFSFGGRKPSAIVSVRDKDVLFEFDFFFLSKKSYFILRA